jgi:hypothetical protein
VKRREAWFDNQPDLDPERLVFIDETWASTNMARLRGRAPKGERLRAGIPHGHWRTTTFVAGLRLTGMVAPMVLDGPINGHAFPTSSLLLDTSRINPNLASGAPERIRTSDLCLRRATLYPAELRALAASLNRSPRPPQRRRDHTDK